MQRCVSQEKIMMICVIFVFRTIYISNNTSMLIKRFNLSHISKSPLKSIFSPHACIGVVHYDIYDYVRLVDFKI